MSKKYHVTRIKHVLQSTAVVADSSSEAIEKSRKLLRKDWKNVDDKRRRNYTATPVSYQS